MDKHQPQRLEPIDPWTRLKPLQSDALRTFSQADRARAEQLTQALRAADQAEASKAKRKHLFAQATALLLDIGEEVADAALDIVLDRIFDLDDPDDLAANVAVGVIGHLKTL